MITRCPSCHTHFRVHQEQLAARAGQVRCGKCSRIFDALEHLTDAAPPERGASAAQEYASPGVSGAVVEPAPAVAADVGTEVLQPAIAESAGAAAAAMQVDAAPSEPTTPEPAPAQPVDVEAGEEPGETSFDFGPIAAADPANRARRWPWMLGALLLLLILLAQAAYYYRSALIVLFPQAKPYAVELCAVLGCDLPLPRRIELMSIEASDLQADTANPNIMVLSATLKNRAIFGQQLPLLELTLTDAQDLPLVRRVLAPQDYIGKAANIQAGFGANTEIAIKVYVEGSQVKATGYRLYLFYP